MAWPPATSSSFIVNNSADNANIRWGTDGMYGTAIVKSARVTKMAEEIKIENGTGLTAIQILLVDGDEVEFTCVYDENIDRSDLQIDETFAFIDASTTSENEMATGATTINYTVVACNLNAARKQETEFTVTGKKYTLIPID